MNIQKYLNMPHVWSALGVPSSIKHYYVASDKVALAFMRTNDPAISMQQQVQYILVNQIDVLFYQGKFDLACNTAGQLRWADSMPWKGQAEFNSKSLMPWKSSSVDGKASKKVGTFKGVEKAMIEGSKKKTRFSLVTVDRSGHMVSFLVGSIMMCGQS